MKKEIVEIDDCEVRMNRKQNTNEKNALNREHTDEGKQFTDAQMEKLVDYIRNWQDETERIKHSIKEGLRRKKLREQLLSVQQEFDDGRQNN